MFTFLAAISVALPFVAIAAILTTGAGVFAFIEGMKNFPLPFIKDLFAKAPWLSRVLNVGSGLATALAVLFAQDGFTVAQLFEAVCAGLGVSTAAAGAHLVFVKKPAENAEVVAEAKK